MEPISTWQAERRLRFGSGDFPPVLTFVYMPPELGHPYSQFQWDYQIDWPRGGKPTINVLSFRSYQRRASDGPCELAEAIWDDIPINDSIMRHIAEHAASLLSWRADLDGRCRLAESTLLTGCEEAAKKGFDLSTFRKMMQSSTTNPSLF